MKKPSIPELVFKKILPNPRANDPPTFFGHVQRNLVPEVRHEVQQVFYGSLDCVEAQYPGLDYTFEPHRRRLSRYPWHKRLFRTFEELGLTDNEILSLCQWEGTRSAKERYEAETKRKIVDTTADDVAPAPPSRGPSGRLYNWTEVEEQVSTKSGIHAELQTAIQPEAEQSDEDEVASSIGLQLNQQLQAAVEARSRGEEAIVDAQWEQWMKEAMERNVCDRDTIIRAIREGRPLEHIPHLESSRRTSSMPQRNSSGAVQSAAFETVIDPESRATFSPADPTYDELTSMLSDLPPSSTRLNLDNTQMPSMVMSRSQPETAR